MLCLNFAGIFLHYLLASIIYHFSSQYSIGNNFYYTVLNRFGIYFCDKPGFFMNDYAIYS